MNCPKLGYRMSTDECGAYRAAFPTRCEDCAGLVEPRQPRRTVKPKMISVGITGNVLSFWHKLADENGESITAIVGDLMRAVADGSVRLVR